MYFSYQFKDISEFERTLLKQRFSDELQLLNEIQLILEEALCDISFSKKNYLQQLRTEKLVSSLEDKIKQVELDEQLKMLILSLNDMRKIRKALKKRRIGSVGSGKTLQEVAFLEEKMNDEICRDECGLEKELKGFPISQNEVDILLETNAS